MTLLLGCQSLLQITVAAMTGSKVNEFVQKVQHAATGHPWYSNAPPRVNQSIDQSVNL